MDAMCIFRQQLSILRLNKFRSALLFGTKFADAVLKYYVDEF